MNINLNLEQEWEELLGLLIGGKSVIDNLMTLSMYLWKKGLRQSYQCAQKDINYELYNCNSNNVAVHRYTGSGSMGYLLYLSGLVVSIFPSQARSPIWIPAGATQLKWRNQLLYSGDSRSWSENHISSSQPAVKQLVIQKPRPPTDVACRLCTGGLQWLVTEQRP